MSRAGNGLLIGFGASLALAGCTTGSVQSSSSAAPERTNVTLAGEAHPGSIRTGAQTSGMAAQYSHPRQGAIAAAGASAWVPPAPAPAFVLKDVPPPAPPTPRPVAVANRQPADPAPASGAVDASQLVRPEAAVPDAAAPAPAATLSAATREQGQKLFANYACGSCHALADAGASGSIGPAFDGNAGLTKAYVMETVKTGRGAMPSFDGQMTEQEIATLAEYIVAAHK
jgi:mono/diheme cytochrome c family protein